MGVEREEGREVEVGTTHEGLAGGREFSSVKSPVISEFLGQTSTWQYLGPRYCLIEWIGCRS